MTKLTTYQKRYGTNHSKPTHRDLIGVLVRWQRLLANPIVRGEMDKTAAGLGYQGAFRECVDLTEMMVGADRAQMPCVEPVADQGKEISTVSAIHLATKMG